MTAEAPRSQAWKMKARCVGTDPELFYMVSAEATDAALEICAQCPVIEACLAEALQQEGTSGRHARFGVRGGTTPLERFKHAARPRKSRTVKRRPERKPRAEVTA